MYTNQETVLKITKICYYIFRIEDISNGVYSPHPLEDLTLEEILEIVGKDGWSFDKNNEWIVADE